jgi:hypothetical protein
MSITTFLADLSRKGIVLSQVDEQLDVRAPKGTLTPDLRSEIVERKSEILAFLRERLDGASRTDELPQIVPDRANLHEPFPLTDIQQAYYIGRSGVFDQGDVSIHSYVELDAKSLYVPRLEAAWRSVVGRHEMLRAVVLPDGRQQVLRDDALPAYGITVSDLRGVPQADAEATLSAVRAEMEHQFFAVERWPHFEVRVSLLDGDRARIHFSIDLLCLDGGSVMVVLDDWVKAYTNPDKPLQRLELTYRDYVLADLALKDTDLYRRALANRRVRG